MNKRNLFERVEGNQFKIVMNEDSDQQNNPKSVLIAEINAILKLNDISEIKNALTKIIMQLSGNQSNDTQSSQSQPSSTSNDIPSIIVTFFKTFNEPLVANLKRMLPKDVNIDLVFRNGGSHEIYWTKYREGNPFRYYLLTVHGKDFVIPYPTTAHKFENLTGFNDYRGSPRDVKSFTPAQVSYDGSRYNLVTPGEIT